MTHSDVHSDQDAHSHQHSHGHTHGLVDPTIKRSRAGLRAVGLSLAVLAIAAALQVVVFLATGSIPLGVAFALRSARAESWAGYFVVATIFASACVAGGEAVNRLIHPESIDHLGALAA